jgi:hypothetical protein
LSSRNFEFSSSELVAGTDVKISWNASSLVFVFFFNTAEMLAFSSYGMSSGTPGSNNGVNGTMTLTVPDNDTYFFVVANPNYDPQAFVGYNTSAQETQTISSPTHTTQTTTYVTSSQSLITSTKAQITTVTCSRYFWSWLLGARSCP